MHTHTAQRYHTHCRAEYSTPPVFGWKSFWKFSPHDIHQTSWRTTHNCMVQNNSVQTFIRKKKCVQSNQIMSTIIVLYIILGEYSLISLISLVSCMKGAGKIVEKNVQLHQKPHRNVQFECIRAKYTRHITKQQTVTRYKFDNWLSSDGLLYIIISNIYHIYWLSVHVSRRNSANFRVCMWILNGLCCWCMRVDVNRNSMRDKYEWNFNSEIIKHGWFFFRHFKKFESKSWCGF